MCAAPGGVSFLTKASNKPTPKRKLKASGAPRPPRRQGSSPPPSSGAGRSLPPGAESAVSVPAAPRAFSRSFKGPVPAWRAAHCCPRAEQLAAASGGPFLLRALLPSGTSRHPLRGAHSCPRGTELSACTLCPGPCWLLPVSSLHARPRARPGLNGGGRSSRRSRLPGLV